MAMNTVDSATRSGFIVRLHSLLTASRRQAYGRQTLIAMVVALAMVLSIGVQSVDFYQIIDTNLTPTTNQSDKNRINVSQINPEDFQLLFGFNDHHEIPNTSQEIPLTKMNLILRGVLSEIDNKKYASAIIQTANQDKLYEVGDALPGGAHLHQVYSDHIIIKRGSQLEKLYFPETARDARALREYQPPLQASAEPVRPGNHDYPDDVPLEQRMQDLRERLREASQEL